MDFEDTIRIIESHLECGDADELDTLDPPEYIDPPLEGDSDAAEIHEIMTNSELRKTIVRNAMNKNEEKKKRGPYKNNQSAVQKMIRDRIWYVLPTNECPDVDWLIEHYSINRSTLYTYRTRLRSQPLWVPKPGNQDRQRVFSEEQENRIVDILNDLSDSNIPISQRLIRDIILFYYRSITPEERHNVKLKNFSCSRHFLVDFLGRINWSRRRAHLKRRPDVEQETIDEYRQKVETICGRYQSDHILNADETFWRCADQTLYTYAPIGKDNIQINTPDNEKAGFTVLATVNHEGNKLPLLLVGKGKTVRCEKSQFGFTNPLDQFMTSDDGLAVENSENDIDEENIDDEGDMNDVNINHTVVINNPNGHVTTHSKSGWVDTEIWLKYLHFLRATIPYLPNTDPMDKTNTIFLICDSYSVHHCNDAQTEANKLNIMLIAVPKGTTDECQPLDRRIFGILKTFLRVQLNNHICYKIMQYSRDIENIINGVIGNPQRPKELPRFSKPQACRILFSVWDSLKGYQIRNGWQLAIYGKEEKEDV